MSSLFAPRVFQILSSMLSCVFSLQNRLSRELPLPSLVLQRAKRYHRALEVSGVECVVQNQS